jgi:SAM-dependent methyltransferase
MISSAAQTSGELNTPSIYTDGAYLEKNPLWHIDESPFKTKQILRMLERKHLQPKSICEVGCGAGEVLNLLQPHTSDKCQLRGYDISPQALKMCESRANERLKFKLADVSQEDVFFDLLLVLDVFEHVPDCYGFLKSIRRKGDLKIFHIPLDLSVQAVLRKRGLLTRRELYGHIHYFTKETALETLKDAGYSVLDYFYTPRCIELAKKTIQKIAVLPRQACFAMNEDFTVRVLGGYSLLVLAR